MTRARSSSRTFRRASTRSRSGTLSSASSRRTSRSRRARRSRSRPSWSKVKTRIPESDLHIRITGKQFNWEVTYPGPDGKFDTADDQTLDNEVHVPVGKPVVLHLRAKDVIHSVFIPTARFKQDAVP